jgi:hypothetical protein
MPPSNRQRPAKAERLSLVRVINPSEEHQLIWVKNPSPFEALSCVRNP